MDELEVAQTVFETICAEAEKVKLVPVAATLSCGDMCAVNTEALLEAFASLCEGTPCRGMRLEVRRIPVQMRCIACNTTADYNIAAPHCVKCGSHEFDFLPEPPVLLEDIEFKDK